MDQTLVTGIGSAVPTLAMILAILDRDFRDWAKITRQQNTDVARLDEKTGLD